MASCHHVMTLMMMMKAIRPLSSTTGYPKKKVWLKKLNNRNSATIKPDQIHRPPPIQLLPSAAPTRHLSSAPPPLGQWGPWPSILFPHRSNPAGAPLLPSAPAPAERKAALPPPPVSNVKQLRHEGDELVHWQVQGDRHRITKVRLGPLPGVQWVGGKKGLSDVTTRSCGPINKPQ